MLTAFYAWFLFEYRLKEKIGCAHSGMWLPCCLSGQTSLAPLRALQPIPAAFPVCVLFACWLESSRGFLSSTWWLFSFSGQFSPGFVRMDLCFFTSYSSGWEVPLVAFSDHDALSSKQALQLLQ